RVYQSSGEFSGTIGTEVEEDYAVPILDPAVRSANHRRYKFISFTSLISGPDGFHAAGCLAAFTRSESVIGELDSFPALIAIHSIVPAGNDADSAQTFFFQEIFQLPNIFNSGG